MRRGFPFAAVLFALLMATASVTHAVSPRGAFFRSLIVPGWGQYAIGATDRALVFGGIEAGLWVTAAGFSAMGSIYTSDYRAMAASVAGAAVEGKPRKYFDHLAFYETRTQYNQVAVIGGPDTEYYRLADDWQWPTTADRLAYRSRYNDAKRMDQAIRYVMLGVTLNHFSSAIDAGRKAGNMRDADTDSRPALGMNVIPLPDGGRMVFSLRF